MAWVIPLSGDYAISWGFHDWDETHTYQHQGIDFGTLGIEGLAVVAPTILRIDHVGWDNDENHSEGYGYYIAGHTDDGLMVFLGHLQADSATVQPGDIVSAGQLLGYSGNTGHSTGPHLHLEVRDGSTILDPSQFLEGASDAPEYPVNPTPPEYREGNESPTISVVPKTLSGLYGSIAGFLTWIKDINYKKLGGNIAITTGGLLVLLIGIYAILQTQAAQQLGTTLGNALGKAIKQGEPTTASEE